MSHHQFLRTDAIGDVMLLELHDVVSSLSDHAILNEVDVIRRQQREMSCTKLIFDLGQVPFFGSALLELIRVLWNDLSARGGRLVLCNPSTFGREVLEIAKFDQIWPLVETREQAVDLMGSGPNVAQWPKTLQELLVNYDHGPTLLRNSLVGFTSIQLRTPAPPGTWSVLQIVCHLADSELLYADRMKRVVAEDQPTLFVVDPDVFAAKLAYAQRDVEEELDVIMSVRREMSRILRTLPITEFERTGVHSRDGSLTLLRLLERVVDHIQHHVQFIDGKKDTLLNR